VEKKGRKAEKKKKQGRVEGSNFAFNITAY